MPKIQLRLQIPVQCPVCGYYLLLGNIEGTLWYHQKRHGAGKGTCPNEGKTFKIKRLAPMFVDAEEVPSTEVKS